MLTCSASPTFAAIGLWDAWAQASCRFYVKLASFAASRILVCSDPSPRLTPSVCWAGLLPGLVSAQFAALAISLSPASSNLGQLGALSNIGRAGMSLQIGWEVIPDPPPSLNTTGRQHPDPQLLATISSRKTAQ